MSRNIYFAILALFLTAALFTGCRHDVLDADGETVSAVITPLQIGPMLLPFGEEDVTTYGLSTGLETMERDSCGIFASILGSGFTGTNYGVSAGLAFGIDGRESSFNGISAGLLHFSDFLGYGSGSGTQNGISVFPFVFNSHTNGLSVEATTLGKDFNGIDICLFNLYGTRGAGSMVMCADGNVDSFDSLAQLDPGDWFVAGCGDYNGDQKDDLLVRQYSTGMLGYYVCADQSQWVEMGRGVDMNWIVIA